jgi:hypothetical protein
MDQTIWVLAVTPEGEPEPTLSIHPTYEAAADWLRTGWDADGRFEGDDDQFADELRGYGYGVVIEGFAPYWTEK